MYEEMNQENMFLTDDEINYQSATFPDPRDFQEVAHESLREGARAGHRCQMVMAPTGAGKTYLGLRIIHESLKKGKKAVFLCDRTTLIDQTSQVADTYGLGAHGVFQANHWRSNINRPFQIASVQTLARRKWPDADVIVIDEAHTMYKGWTEHIPKCRAMVIGLSATPFSKGLGNIFTNLVNAATMDNLTKSGVLVPMRVMSCTKIDMREAKVIAGEWSGHEVETRGMEIIGDVVKEWLEYAQDKKTIIFGATINHCEEMARSFNDAGINAAVFTSHTLPEERAELLKEYKKLNGKLKVLISVEALAKGFDVKDVECVCDCRPLRKSLSTAMQMWGRGLRSSPETNKTECLLLDFSGNIVRFLEDYEDIYFNGLDALDAGEKLDKVVRKDDEEEKPESKCPKCGTAPFARKCMACGFEKITASSIEIVQGEMMEIRIGKAVAAENVRDLWNQVCTYARSNSAPDKQRGRAYHLYKSILGQEPNKNWSFDASPNVPLTRAVINKIKQGNIAFSHRARA
ncbi:MAG: hypothetical protein RIR39_1389 [Pseudomonadota bacterium]|jgi:superfamily II DNA or RNA helicase